MSAHRRKNGRFPDLTADLYFNSIPVGLLGDCQGGSEPTTFGDPDVEEVTGLRFNQLLRIRLCEQRLIHHDGNRAVLADLSKVGDVTPGYGLFHSGELKGFHLV